MSRFSDRGYYDDCKYDYRDREHERSSPCCYPGPPGGPGGPG